MSTVFVFFRRPFLSAESLGKKTPGLHLQVHRPTLTNPYLSVYHVIDTRTLYKPSSSKIPAGARLVIFCLWDIPLMQPNSFLLPDHFRCSGKKKVNNKKSNTCRSKAIFSQNIAGVSVFVGLFSVRISRMWHLSYLRHASVLDIHNHTHTHTHTVYIRTQSVGRSCAAEWDHVA